VGRAEKSVDSDEQLADLGGIALSKRADGYLFAHNLIPADELPRIPGVRRGDPSESSARAGIIAGRDQFGVIEAAGRYIDLVREIDALEY
jgi:hypothetical protein